MASVSPSASVPLRQHGAFTGEDPLTPNGSPAKQDENKDSREPNGASAGQDPLSANLKSAHGAVQGRTGEPAFASAWRAAASGRKGAPSFASGVRGGHRASVPAVPVARRSTVIQSPAFAGFGMVPLKTPGQPGGPKSSFKFHAEIVQTEKKDGALWYNIQAKMNGKEALISKRYSDFASFDSRVRMSETLADVLPPLPPGGWLGIKQMINSEGFHKRRQEGLQKWLDALTVKATTNVCIEFLPLPIVALAEARRNTMLSAQTSPV